MHARSFPLGPIELKRLVWLSIAAFGLRLFYFTGLSLGDDVFYALQSIAHARHLSWPPLPYHWQTRLGVTIPTSVSLAFFGLKPFAFVLWPLLASTATVTVAYLVAREFLSERAAVLVAIFQTCFPLELIYATHLFPDVLVGLFATLSIWFWIRGLRGENTGAYVWSGVFFAAGYLCRETVLMLGPIYVALWIFVGGFRRPEVLWACVVPAALILCEATLYWATTGSPMYRWSAIAAQQHSELNQHLVETSTAGGSFWLDPLLMLSFNQEFGLYQISALFIALYTLIRVPALRVVAVWWLAGFVWSYYGTTVPDRYVPLQRDPRYAAPLTVPALVLVASVVDRMRHWSRIGVASCLVMTGIVAAGLDQGNSVLTAHKKLLQSEKGPEISLEPFEYFGARWQLGLKNKPVFSCLDDAGRGSVVQSLSALDDVNRIHLSNSRYVVFSPDRRPDLLGSLLANGWHVTEQFEMKPGVLRHYAGRALALIPSQAQRAERVLHPPGLLLLQKQP
jgi:hypothetical protein